MNTFLLLRLKLFDKRFCVMSIIDYFCIVWGGRLLGKPRLTCASSGKIWGKMAKRIFSRDGGSTAKIFLELAKVKSLVKGDSIKRMYSELLAG